MTAQHNTFARRHALAEIAGEFEQGASIGKIERSTSGYLEDGTVVRLGWREVEHRFTTRDLLACARAIVEGAVRRVGERPGLVHPRLPDLVLAELGEPLSSQQADAARALAPDGRGLSVLQALAGTGKTRVLGALARIYESAGYRVIGVAPTGRAARELGDAAGIESSTIHRLVSDVEEFGGLAPRSVVLFDEASSATTRPSASLLSHAERAGAKVIAAGDSGQLPSVAAGGWFAGIARELGGPELRQVVRQRDRSEREALEPLHDGNPEPYLALKRNEGSLTVHREEIEAVTSLLADWNAARSEYGLTDAVMIARDNATRVMLNERARLLLQHQGAIAARGVMIAGQEFAIGDRVIARRNDRCRDVDNGTLGRVEDLDPQTGTITVVTDSDERRQLDGSYVADHLEHAYALTGHGAHGATVEWAGVIGRPSEFTREWAYTSLSRARARTHVYVIREATRAQREREQCALPEPERTSAEALEILTRSMTRREAEVLALQEIEGPDLTAAGRSELSRTPLTDLPEAAADHATTFMSSQMSPHITGPEPFGHDALHWLARGRDRDTGRSASPGKRARRSRPDPPVQDRQGPPRAVGR